MSDHAHFDEEGQEKQLHDLQEKEEEQLSAMMAQKFGLPYIDLTINPINIDALRAVKVQDSRDCLIAPFNLIHKKLSVVVVSPVNPKTAAILDELRNKGFEIIVYLGSHSSLQKVWDHYKDLSYSSETQSGALDISNETIKELLESISSIKTIKDEIEHIIAEKKNFRISKVLEIIIAGALATGASDVHIEAEEKLAGLRFRLDGVLNQILEIDSNTYRLLVSRIKLISNLKLNIKDAPQDGRFSIKLETAEIEVRVSMLPGNYGESVVMRILNPDSISVPLEALGIHPKLLAILLKEINKPNGMILNTGPTGSGKTTTLYAFLKKIYSPELKIITIENPIEYHLKGIVQTQTNEEKGYTFLEGLRSAMRQDPDAIMIGEIRDKETASVAINSALTGHIVFSTLHTNEAAGTYPRLIDLGINPKIITSALTCAMAQRLVRTLCKVCKKQVELDDSSKTMIQKIIDTIKDKEYLKDIDMKNTFEAAGCEKCNFTGYKGRIGIYEAILSTEAIEQVVNQNPSEREIMKAAEDQGILNMKQDGIVKFLQGMTTLDELTRVIDMEK